MRGMKRGKIDISGLKMPPEKCEFRVAKILSDLGQNIIFIPQSNIKNIKRPDFEIAGEKWELKSPIGSSRRTLQNNIHKAQFQSKNIIIDLSRSKINEQKAISQIKFEFAKRKSIKKLKIITKDGHIIDLKR